ncbi:unnamed protein product [Clavelina lepadiformis]|uniref:Uncharacterized protein n=1 Tax=Clavelina lepadiformis TaxID=159417 RepID=A0ABP0H5J3_CLALP
MTFCLSDALCDSDEYCSSNECVSIVNPYLGLSVGVIIAIVIAIIIGIIGCIVACVCCCRRTGARGGYVHTPQTVTTTTTVHGAPNTAPYGFQQQGYVPPGQTYPPQIAPSYATAAQGYPPAQQPVPMQVPPTQQSVPLQSAFPQQTTPYPLNEGNQPAVNPYYKDPSGPAPPPYSQ